VKNGLSEFPELVKNGEAILITDVAYPWPESSRSAPSERDWRTSAWAGWKVPERLRHGRKTKS